MAKETVRHTEAVSHLLHLLQADLNNVTREQQEAAETALHADPSIWQLTLAVKRWAHALATVCRSHAGRCAEIHAEYGKQDPSTSAMGTIGLALSDLLELPADGTLSHQDWPDENGLRSFVLQAAGAPIELIGGELVTKPTLPRCEPKSGFARRIARLEPHPPHGQNAAFLSVDETQRALSGLEESFRKTLLESLGTSFSEAQLESLKTSIVRPRQPNYFHSKPGRKPKHDERKDAIRNVAREHPEYDTRELCLAMDRKAERNKKLLPPHFCRKTCRLWTDAYDARQTRGAVGTYISKAKTATRKSL